MLITYIKTAALCLFVEMKAFEYVKSVKCGKRFSLRECMEIVAAFSRAF